MSTALFEFEQRLGTSVSDVLEKALAADPPGACPEAWQALLSRHGVAALGEDERYAAAKREKLFRGAPVEEVGACLAAVAAGATRDLALLSIGAPDCERLGALIERMPGAALDHYRRIACERAKGGMFAHAMASAKEHKYDDYRLTRGYVLKCPHCGAPRLREADYRCEFCGESIAGGTP